MTIMKVICAYSSSVDTRRRFDVYKTSIRRRRSRVSTERLLSSYFCCKEVLEISQEKGKCNPL